MPTIMAGDIGGTSSRFMLYEVFKEEHLHQGSRAPGTLLFSHIYANEGVPTFSAQVSAFLKDAGAGEPPTAACIAVAGPVLRNRVTMTNRNWIIDGGEIEERFNIREVRLVNDFVAAGYGLLTLDAVTECAMLQAGERKEGAPIACLGSGTGLGETFLTCPVGGKTYDAWATEGGHSELAPKNDEEYEFVKYIMRTKNTSRVSVERIASGTGLVNVYDFLTERYPERVDKAVHEAVQAAGDQKGKIISINSCVPGSICEQVMEMWATHYGSEAGVVGLRYIPTGGLFLAGGMTPKNLRLLQGEDSPFMEAFRDKGRVSGILESIPVYAVLVEDIGQRGAHYVAFRMYERQPKRARAKDKVSDVAKTTPIAMIAAVTSVLTLGVLLRTLYHRKN